MRGLSTFLIASTLLTLGLTAPTGGLEDHGLSILEDRGDSRPSTPPASSGNQDVPGAPGKANPKKPFPLDDFIKEWFDVDRVQETLKYAAEFTKGGYEGWVQVEWDLVAKAYKTVNVQPSDREVLVYLQSAQDKADGKKEKRADFVFESTDTTKGLIVELKTENQKSQGATFIREVKADVEKLRGQYKPEYDSNDYTKVAIAIAWSQQAHDAFDKGDLQEMVALDGIQTRLSEGQPLKVYRMDVEPDRSVDEVTKKFEAASISDQDCDNKQKRSSPECQRKTGSSNPSTGTKDISGNEGKAATADQPAKAGKKNKASKPAKAGKQVKAGGRKSTKS